MPNADPNVGRTKLAHLLLCGLLLPVNPGMRSSNPALPIGSSGAATGFLFSSDGLLPNAPSRSSSSSTATGLLFSALPNPARRSSSYAGGGVAAARALVANTSSYAGAAEEPNTPSSYRGAEEVVEVEDRSPGTASKMSSSYAGAEAG